jgi:hypothetical protein
MCNETLFIAPQSINPKPENDVRVIRPQPGEMLRLRAACQPFRAVRYAVAGGHAAHST